MKIRNIWIKKSGLCGVLWLVAQIGSSVPFTYDLTHDGLSRVTEVQINQSSVHEVDFTYRDNGQLDVVTMDGPDSLTGNAPVAAFSVTPDLGGTINDIHQLDASSSTDSEDALADLLVRWDFEGDGVWDSLFQTNKQLAHSYTQPGDYLCRLEVKDTDGRSTLASQVISVFDDLPNQLPVPVLNISVGQTGMVDTAIAFSWGSSYDPDGEVIRYEVDYGIGAPQTWAERLHDFLTYDAVGSYTVQLTVTDNRGMSVSTSKPLEIVEEAIPAPPTISTSGAYFEIEQDQLLSVPLTLTSGTDPVVTASGAVGGYVEIDAAQYFFKWRPSGNISGDYGVTLQIRDSYNQVANHNITVHVNASSSPAQWKWRIVEKAEGTIQNDVTSIDIEGSTLYLSAGDTKDLVSVNIANPQAPIEYPYVDIAGNSQELVVENGIIYLAAYNDGIQLYSVGSSPSLYGEFDPSGSGQFYNVAAAGRTVFGINDSGTLWVINANTLSNPSEYTHIDGVNGSRMATWNGLGYLYVATSSGLKIINYQTPASASYVGMPISGNVRSLYIPPNETTLYLAIDHEIRVYDLANRTSPSLIASGSVGEYGPAQLTVDENGRIFAQDRLTTSSIYLLERNGSGLTELAQIPMGTVLSMRAENGYLYVGHSDDLFVYQYEYIQNQRPIAYNTNVTTYVNQSIPITLAGYDADQDPLTFSKITDSNQHGTLSGTEPNLTFIPSGSFEGQGLFEFIVNDGTEDSVQATVVIDVILPPQPPVIGLITNQYTLDEGAALSFGVTATDPNVGDVVTLTVANLPTGASYTNNVFAWIPADGQAGGPYVITFTATDSTALSFVTNVNIQVEPVNHPPVVDLFTASPLFGKTPLSVAFSVQAHDADGSLVSTNIHYGDGQQSTSLQHVYVGAGSYTSRVTVTDHEGATDSKTQVIVVQEPSHGMVQFDNTSLQVDEGAGVVAAQVERIHGSDGAVSVQWNTTEGTALENSDYIGVTPTTIHWAEGDSAPKPIAVSITDDHLLELEETFSLSLSNPQGGVVLGSNTMLQVTIADNDVQEIQLYSTNLYLPEGDLAELRVKLTAQPTNHLSVNISKTSGDEDISLSGGSTLSFASTNWSDYQSVVIQGSEDEDAVSGEALFSVQSTGLSAQTVTVTEVENDTLSIETDVETLDVLEGGSTNIQVRLTAAPVSPLPLDVVRLTGDTDIQITGGQTLLFNAENWYVYQEVTLEALVDVDAFSGQATLRIDATNGVFADITVFERDVAPVVEFTNENATVVHSTISYTLHGTNNAYVVGTMIWTNALTAQQGSFSAFPAWSVPNIVLETGENGITVMGTNQYGQVASDTVTITRLTNRPPVLLEESPQSVVMDEDGSPTPFSLTLHASEPDGDEITWSIHQAAENGMANVGGTGSSKDIHYTPNSGYVGPDSFEVQVADGIGGVDTLSVHVSILSQNDPPVIQWVQPNGSNDHAYLDYTLQWVDEDPDDDATISLYYDTNDSGQDGTLIVSNLREDDPIDQYLWDVRLLPEGSYYLYAVITDGVNDPVVQYNSDPVMIDRTRHFPEILGNPMDPVWTVHLQTATLNEMDLEPGDEIGLFDGTTLVGSYLLDEVLTEETQWEHFIKAWSTRNESGDGYLAGHPYRFICWDRSEQVEISSMTVTHIPHLNAHTDDTFPLGDNPYSVIRLDGIGLPYVDITNHTESVIYATSTYTLHGTNNAYVTGAMSWSNRLTGLYGNLLATPVWSIADLSLQVGDNRIWVEGTNDLGDIASDVVTITRSTYRPEEPVWWYQRDVLIPDVLTNADDFAVVNLGQLRHIALQAYEEMEVKLPGGAGSELTRFIQSMAFAGGDNYVVVNIGQLKAVAQPFYDRLGFVYPWEGLEADDYAVVNVGQIKALFSFSIE